MHVFERKNVRTTRREPFHYHGALKYVLVLQKIRRF